MPPDPQDFAAIAKEAVALDRAVQEEGNLLMAMHKAQPLTILASDHFAALAAEYLRVANELEQLKANKEAQ